MNPKTIDLFNQWKSESRWAVYVYMGDHIWKNPNFQTEKSAWQFVKQIMTDHGKVGTVKPIPPSHKPRGAV
jgi:hypothetical protein